MTGPRLFILDYGAGNVHSIANSISSLGYSFDWVTGPDDFAAADKLIFPGVGAFASAVKNLKSKGMLGPLKDYINSGRPYFGICIGMQILFRESVEAADLAHNTAGTSVDNTLEEDDSIGLGIIDWRIERFASEKDGRKKAVPHMGWNGVSRVGGPSADGLSEEESYYFVHSYRAAFAEDERIRPWAWTTTRYEDEEFVSSVKRGNVFATQFHPEKSGEAGLNVLRAWLEGPDGRSEARMTIGPQVTRVGLRKRIIACLDVRSNDAGDLVVTKGDQYDVRERDVGDGSRPVRNLGKPVALAERYYSAGADEVCLLNITSFRNSPLRDQPMLEVVREAAKRVFVPLTIGGGIKDSTDPDGTRRSALEVAGEYFRAGADKVSIGSEAVVAVEKMMERAGGEGDGTSAIEEIARAYGRQAVVVSIDPKRVYIQADAAPSYEGRYRRELIVGAASETAREEDKDKAWWYQCTINGGRVLRDLSVVELARGVERLGAGEILLNCIDRDGTGLGFDLDLVRLVKSNVGIPVIASSGAGNAQHFVDVFTKTQVEAALAAGILHRGEVQIGDIKRACQGVGLRTRGG
ncbi:Histidine biosynthesis bifunctional protein hisB [Tulasnella sp. 403]|nr:Histidine biosynthesis bifunctional protein hisB [Tulasnella sp. 403]